VPRTWVCSSRAYTSWACATSVVDLSFTAQQFLCRQFGGDRGHRWNSPVVNSFCAVHHSFPQLVLFWATEWHVTFPSKPVRVRDHPVSERLLEHGRISASHSYCRCRGPLDELDDLAALTLLCRLDGMFVSYLSYQTASESAAEQGGSNPPSPLSREP